MKQKVFLIGMPGSGKSTIGKALGSLIGIPFYDLDKLIETAEGYSPSEIFSRFSEDYFRSVEARELKKVIDLPHPFVLATGGGTPCFHNNMALLLKSGFTIFLDPPMQVLYQRLAHSKNRPLLNTEGSETINERLDRLKKDRLPFYELANLRITEESIPVERLIQLIP